MTAKRICVVSIVLLVLCSAFAVSASAYASTSIPRYSAIQFSYVGFGTNYNVKQEYTANVVGTSLYQFSGPVANTIVNAARDSIFVEYNTGASYLSIRMHADTQVVDLEQLRNMTFEVTIGTDGDLPGSFRITGSVIVYELTNGSWKPVYRPFDARFNFTGAGNIGVELAEAISAVTNDRYVLLNYLNVDVASTYSQGDGFDGVYYFEIPSVSTLPSYALYANQYDLYNQTIVDASSSTDGDFVDWLVVAVTNFMTIELWPGFSLNQLLSVVVVIGILFAFLKFNL